MNDINSKIILSNHGLERILERTHCKKNQIEKFLCEVWASGHDIKHYETKRSVYQYLVNTIKVGGTDRALRVKGNTLYIFNKVGTVFITCYDLPQKVIQDRKGGKSTNGSNYRWQGNC